MGDLSFCEILRPQSRCSCLENVELEDKGVWSRTHFHISNVSEVTDRSGYLPCCSDKLLQSSSGQRKLP